MTCAIFISDDLIFFLSEKSASPYSPQSCKWANLSGKRFFIFSFHWKFTQSSLPKERKCWLFFPKQEIGLSWRVVNGPILVVSFLFYFHRSLKNLLVLRSENWLICLVGLFFFEARNPPLLICQRVVNGPISVAARWIFFANLPAAWVTLFVEHSGNRLDTHAPHFPFLGGNEKVFVKLSRTVFKELHKLTFQCENLKSSQRLLALCGRIEWLLAGKPELILTICQK